MMNLYIKEKGNRYRKAQKSELVSAALDSLQHAEKGQAMTSPHDVRAYLALHLAELEAETFAIMYLDTRHQLIAFERLFNGTLDGAAVYPREVVKAALQKNAAAVILSHNHPSGVAEPSRADEQLTQRLKDALALIDVRVLDHIIVGANETTSLAERGLL